MGLDIGSLREAIQKEYQVVSDEPERDFHFHVGMTQARLVEYDDALLSSVPEPALKEMARVFKTSGRLQITDILVGREAPDSAWRQSDLWTG